MGAVSDTDSVSSTNSNSSQVTERNDDGWSWFPNNCTQYNIISSSTHEDTIYINSRFWRHVEIDDDFFRFPPVQSRNISSATDSVESLALSDISSFTDSDEYEEMDVDMDNHQPFVLFANRQEAITSSSDSDSDSDYFFSDDYYDSYDSDMEIQPMYIWDEVDRLHVEDVFSDISSDDLDEADQEMADLLFGNRETQWEYFDVTAQEMAEEMLHDILFDAHHDT